MRFKFKASRRAATWRFGPRLDILFEEYQTMPNAVP